MENSFSEYRDKTVAHTSSDDEIIDDSMILESVPYSVKKKKRTAFVPESDESISNDDFTKELITNVLPSKPRRSSAAGALVVSSSEDDGSRRGSLRKPSVSHNNMVLSSSEEDEEYSPELVPKRRPPSHQKSSNLNGSLILQKTKKRMLFQDSDTDNSIIIERNSNAKLKCLKDTPLKIEGRSKVSINESIDCDESCDGDDDDDYDDNDDDEDDKEIDDNASDLNTDKNKKSKKNVIDSEDDENDETSEHQTNTNFTKKCKKLVISSDESDGDEISAKAVKTNDISNDSHKSDHDNSSNNSNQKSDDVEIDDDDDGPDEDMMVMSRATRMSIMGIIPKDNDSDESDYIQSDSSSHKTAESIAASHEDTRNLDSKTSDYEPMTHKISEKSDDDLPEVTMNHTQAVSEEVNNKHEIPDDDGISIHSNDSRISCSRFTSPLKDITNTSIEKTESKRKSKALNSSKKLSGYMDLTVMPDVEPDNGVIDLSNAEPNFVRNKVLDKSASLLTRQHAVDDDDVTIVDTKPEIIALSSDDENAVKPDRRSRKSKSPEKNASQGPVQRSMQQFLAPSRPGQVVYVKKHVKENELNKLMRLKEDLNSVRALLNEMDLESLPDGGSRLLARHSALEGEVRRQGDRVANMLVEPDQPTAADMAKDGFDAGLSWDEIQKASKAVQPRMFGKQAMATHMAEQGHILARLRDLHASLGSRPGEGALAAAPRLLRSTLMPYQRHALAWLQWRETQKPASGILADDMGLGKTITMISLVAGDKEHRLDHDDPDEDSVRDKLVRGGTLVVCPASLIQQWASEVTKHCTAHALSVALHHGAARAAQPHRLAAHDMVLTTYNILQRDSGKNGVLMRVQWRRVILDEAHIVRNHKAATSLAVSALRARRRWCLTGTPVQNKDLDLFALLKFLRLSPFDDLQMWKKWIDNKSAGGQERLSIIMQCILLRRTKAGLQACGQLACLPPRTAHARPVTLTRDEMNVYQKVLVLSKSLFAQFLHQRAEKNSGGGGARSPPNKNSEYDKMHKKMIALQGVKPVKSHEILVLLLRLRQVCCHCGLIGSMLDAAEPGAEPEPAGADLLRELDKLSLEDDRRKSQNPPNEEEVAIEESSKADEAIRAVLAPNHPVFQLDRPSSKIAAVMDCLDENVFCNKGHKAVVVSQWTSVLSLVEGELKKKKIRSVTLSGSVPVPARPRLIDQVNDPKSDVRVMLLSLCAGGVGINLCGANHLLLLDPHWNPQLEEQAQDRIYRVGQDKPVHIYRFVCVDTVEQTIRKLQEAKLQLADNVLTGAGHAAGSPLSVEELKMLFNMGS